VRKLTYDTVRDFAGVTVTYNSAYLLVAPPSLGVWTVKDLVPLASSVNLVRDGKLRALGVTSAKCVGIQPDVPTIAESGLPGFVWDSWGGIIAPAKTPRAIIRKLNREITRALGLPDIPKRMRALGAEPAPSTPEAFDKLIAEQVVAVGAVARKAGIRPQ